MKGPIQKIQQKNKTKLRVDLTKSTKKSSQIQTAKQKQTSSSKSKLSKHSRKKSDSKLSQPKLGLTSSHHQSAHQQFKQSLTNSTHNKSHSRQASSIIHTNNNDYCVNQYFVINKQKPKQDKKSILHTNNNNTQYPHNTSQQYRHQDNYYYDYKESKSQIEVANQQYGIQLQWVQKPQKNNKKEPSQQTSRLTNMMKKLTLNQNAHAINENGKIITVKKHTHTKSNSKNLTNSFSQNTVSFSKQYLDKNPNNKSKAKSKTKMTSKSKQMRRPQNKLQTNRDKSKKQKQVIVHDTLLMKSKSADKINSQYANIFQKRPKHNNNTQNINKIDEESRKTKQKQPVRYQSSYFPINNYTSSTTTINYESSSLSSSSSTSTLKINQNYASLIKIDWKQVADQIKAQMETSEKVYKREKQFSKSKLLMSERMKCINLMGRICSQLKTKRDTFYLAVNYFDKYILNYETPNKKGVALACLMIALKMDYSEILSKYISSFRPNPQITIKKTSKSHKKKKSELSNSSSQSVLKNKDSVIECKDKLSSLVTMPIYQNDKKDPYGQEKQEDFHIGEIINIETQIMYRLKFKFYYKSYAYWIDLLTTMWDQYIMGIVGSNNIVNLKGSSNNLVDKNNNNVRDTPERERMDSRWVFFKRSIQSGYVKTHKQQKLLSFLVQSCQSSFGYPFNKLNPVSIVLSLMYLLLRLHIQESRSENPLSVYSYYKQQLSKSCNLVFCDSTGVNEIFVNFLSRINLSMAVIVDSITFVSKLVNVEEFKVWNYRQQFGETYSDRLTSFIFNQKLYLNNNTKHK